MDRSLWHPTLELHTTVRVILLGFDNDGQDDGGRLVVQPQSLQRALQEAMPKYHAPIAASESASMQSGTTRATDGVTRRRSISTLEVKYDMSYEVQHASKNFHAQYVNALADGAHMSLEDGIRTWLVPIDVVSGTVEALALKETNIASELKDPTFGDNDITILIAQPSPTNTLSSLKDRSNGSPDAKETLPYRFVVPDRVAPAAPKRRATVGESCTTSWVGRGRVLILDLGAAGCGHDMGREHELLGLLTGDAAMLHQRGVSGSQQGTSRTGRGDGVPDPMTLFNLQLCSSVVSAMHTIVAPVVPAAPGPGDAGDVIMVPLLVFHGASHVDGMNFDEASAMEDLVNVTQVSKVLNAMALPGQEVVVVSATHSLSEHPQVAVALEKSFATKRVSEVKSGRGMFHRNREVLQERYVDGGRLLLEMKSAGDMLTSLLLSDVGTDSVLRLDVALAAENGAQSSARRGGAGVRVLPAFVFCLTGGEESLIDASSGSAAGTDPTSDEHLASRKRRSVTSFEGGSHFWAEMAGDNVLVIQSGDESVTQPVTSGLLRALHGTIAPDHRWSPDQQSLVLDLSWARGYHPFAPFGFGNSEPGDLFVDVARRNAVASRAAEAASTMSEVSGILEALADSSLPSEIISTGLRSDLCRDNAATQEGWGHVFEAAATFGDVPVDSVLGVVGVHSSLRKAVVSFETELKKARKASLLDVMTAMDTSRGDARSVLDQAIKASNELRWCQCTFGRASSASHVPWMIFVVFMLASLYGFALVVATGRRAMLKYIGSSSPGPGSHF